MGAPICPLEMAASIWSHQASGAHRWYLEHDGTHPPFGVQHRQLGTSKSTFYLLSRSPRTSPRSNLMAHSLQKTPSSACLWAPRGSSLLQNQAGCEGNAFCCRGMLWNNLGSKEGTQQLTREVRGYRNAQAFLELFLYRGSASPLPRNKSA